MTNTFGCNHTGSRGYVSALCSPDKETMRTIAYIGNFEPFWSTENHVKLSLEELGHKVIPLQENKVTAEVVHGIVANEHADLLLWTRTWGLRGDGFEMLRRLPCPSAAFHLDLYAGLDRAATLPSEPWWKCSFVFTADGGSEDFWHEHGVNHFWSPPGVYSQECYRADPDPAYVQDVIFTGSYGYHKEWPYRPELIDRLRAHYGSRFTLYEHSSRMRGHRLNVLYASARVVVGDSCCLGFNHPYYWSDRIPETLGRGGFLIHPRIHGIERHFREDVDLVLYDFNDWSQLYAKIDHYLHHPMQRKIIQRTGHDTVKSAHTYTHRMRVMLAMINGRP